MARILSLKLAQPFRDRNGAITPLFSGDVVIPQSKIIFQPPLLKPDNTISTSVRISSNPDDVNIPLITKMLMKNKIFHHKFDINLSTEETRMYIHELIF